MLVNFNQIETDFAEGMVLNPDVIEIKLEQNMLKVLVKDDANPDNLPASYLHDSGYHIGIMYTTPSRKLAEEEHLKIEAAALEEDKTLGKPTQIKVREYLQRQAKSPNLLKKIFNIK